MFFTYGNIYVCIYTYMDHDFDHDCFSCFNGSLWNEGYLDCRSCEAWLMPFQLYQLRRLGLVGSHGFDTQPYIYIYIHIYIQIYIYI